MKCKEVKKAMEKPYRILKKLQRLGNSVGLVIPKVWFEFKENDDIKEVTLDIYSNKIVVIPYGRKTK